MEARFREQSTEIVIPFTAVDRKDHLVSDLRAQDVRLFDNGSERRLTSLLLEEGPASVLFVIDVSASMKKAIAGVREAIAQMVRSSADGDEFAVMEFSREPEVSVGFTGSDARVFERLRHLEPAGRTSLIDAAVMALKEIEHGRHERKAIVIVSDGSDNHSRYNETDAIRLAMETDARIYGIELYPPIGDGFVAATLLQLLSERTGGRYFPTVSPERIPGLVSKFDVHRFYRAMFSPPAADRDGKYHRIELRLAKRDRLRGGKFFWKRGYQALTE
jgi:Ca-activated chloride channel family protein